MKQLKNQILMLEILQKKKQKEILILLLQLPTMQIESSRKLGLSASQTMRTAQKLYEGTEIDGETTGLITYMRTDSVVMSNEAINQVRSFVGENYGNEYLPDVPRVYKSKAKNAQEAHECIRPTNVNLTPKNIKQYITGEGI
jgi:DNA topoisomerase-1